MWPGVPSCTSLLLCDTRVLASPPSWVEDKASGKSNRTKPTLWSSGSQPSNDETL